MCGFAGLIHPESAKYIESFGESIAHRGPDGKGYFISQNIAIAHRRLAILDLSPNGAQPMYSNDGRYVIVFNGEIYNHLELRLKWGQDIQFKSTSDTETLLYGFIKFGSGLLNQLNGIFTFVILEIATGELFIARDQFGIKPLYYYHHQGVFLFSSEMKTFNKIDGIDKTISMRSFVNYIQFLWSPGVDTPFKHVKKLEAGHYIRINVNTPLQMEYKKYYEIPFSGNYSNETEEKLISALDEKLMTAVKRQLLSDVPIGFFLSGGLDSSLIVAMAKKIRPGNKLKCFTISTTTSSGREGFADDLPYAKKVAEYLDVDLEVINAEIDILRDFDKMIWHLDEPQADAAPLNVWNICKAAREKGYVVLLGGTGGDDLFSGYRRHQALYYERIIRKIPNILISPVVSLMKIFSGANPIVRRVNKFFNTYGKKQTDETLAQYYSWLPLNINKDLFKDAHKDEIKSYDPSSILVASLKNIPAEKNRLNHLLYWDMKYFLTDHNLNYTDKMSMAHGVEVRVPFLDKDLVEFSATIPPSLKMKGLTTKYLLKKVAEKYLPASVIYRPKTGFGAPVRDWITGNMRPLLSTTFSDTNCLKQNIFNCKNVRQLIDANQTGKVDASYSLLALLAIQSWNKQFISGNKDIAETA